LINYIRILFSNVNAERQEVLVAILSEAGYIGFEQTEQELSAYIGEKEFDHDILEEISVNLRSGYEKSIIPAQNWNTSWETNFQPVIVDDFVVVRAEFHSPIAGIEHEILITPKMSFGTGHHATTYMMLQQMRNITFTGKTVLDFGTGTGVLAIFAEKLGAAEVMAIDNDEWSIQNAKENIIRNDCNKISIARTDTPYSADRSDIILANINKNILVDNMKTLASQLAPSGILLLSGLLLNDEDDISLAAKTSGLLLSGRSIKDNWLCLRFLK
jgi:ribosomal protein L11 methyltransferase